MSNEPHSEWQGTEIAIVGAAGRFPGARTLEEYWTLLLEGRESIRALDDAELDAAGVPAAVREHPDYVRRAAVLEDIGWWDAKFWGFSPKDAAIMDPQHRLFLECAYEALESAGIAPDRAPGRIGVYAGVGMGAWFQQVLLRNRALQDDVGLFLLRHTGNDKDFLSTRVSYELDLRGPSVNVQTACSTSLVAMHLAAQALLSGETDVALAGGVTIELPNTAGYLFKENEILSPDGHCRPFDASSAGTVFGSGAGVVVLRRLQDALADGDHILGVIRGSAINNDGNGKVGYLAPSVDGQADAIAEAIAVAGIAADTIDVVEAHGTGTRVGDPIEVQALTQAFRQTTDATGFCRLGSVKSNIGHLDTAAGVASVLKVLLAMQHGEIPPTLHFTSPNPLIDFERTPFSVNAVRVPWPARAHPRRAGVSSLGVGGTNAHLVLEEAPVLPARPAAPTRWQLLPVSARSASACECAATNLADHLREHPELALHDVAHTLQTGRLAHGHRAFVVAASLADAAARLEGTETQWRGSATAGHRSRPVAFQFAGGGAQHADMARVPYRDDDVFRAVFDEGLASLDAGIAAEIRRVLLGPASPADAAAVLERPSIGLPALVITQIALARRLEAWGVEPAAMIGHSMGEYAAAHLAGVFTLADVVRLVAVRGRLFEGVDAGGMLSVPLAPTALTPFLPADVSIAAVNGPELCVASGPLAGIAQLEQRLTEAGLEHRRIRIAVAAHSALLDPILDEFDAFLRSLEFAPPAIPFVSNRTGAYITDDDAMSPRYWVRHLRETVNYAAGLEVLLRDADLLLVEVGPGRTMTQLAMQHSARTNAHVLLHTLPAPQDEVAANPLPTLLQAMGLLWCHGVTLDWAAFADPEVPGRRVPLPTYPWERQRYWLEADPVTGTESASGERHAGADSDARVADVTQWFYEPVWTREAPADEPASVARLWVLGNDVPPVVEALIAALRAAGTEVVMVQHAADEAGAPHVVPGGPISLSAIDSNAWEQVLREARRLQALPSHVLHCWAAEGETAANEATAFSTLAAFGQALARSDGDGLSLRLLVLTRDALAVTGGDVAQPHGALVLGPVLSLPAEVEGVRARAVDLDAASATSRHALLVDELRADLSGSSEQATVAYRHGRRWVRTFRRIPAASGVPAPVVARDGGTYIVTGGLGGVGLTLARTLASQGRVNLVLWSRSALTATGPAAAARQTAVDSLRALGATVHVQPVNVADAAQVEQGWRDAVARCGGVHGVVHAAGVLADGLLALKTPEEMAAVMAPKVHGVQHLAAAQAAHATTPLDFFVCCSSVSAMAGLPGQVDYASANAFLDAWCAREAVRVPWPVVSLAWSAWRETGMVARARGEVQSVPHPLLEQTLRRGEEPLFTVQLDAARHWMMDEHRLLDGTSLVPGTGYLELARAALATWSAGCTLELRDVAFLTPFVLHDDAARELRVAARLDGDRAQFVIAGRVATGEDGSEWEEHVMGSATRVAPTEEPVADLSAVRGAPGLESRPPVPDPHLRFGPRWHNMRRMLVGDGHAVLDLELPEQYASDLRAFALHPALMDMATAGAQCLIPGYEASRDFFVPLSYGVLRQRAPLTPRLTSRISLHAGANDDPDLASFDVVIHDETGRVLVEIEEFLMTRVHDRTQLTGQDTRRRRRRSPLDLDRVVPAGAEAPEPAWYAEAIAPTEGGELFLRGIGVGGVCPHVLVSPFPLAGLLRRLHDAPSKAPSAGSARPLTASPHVPVERVEAVLAEHAAVMRPVVMSRSDRTGSVRLVAYVQLRPGVRATVSELRRAVKKVLPSHLVPSMILLLEDWPVGTDGAIERDALPDPFGASDDVVAPRTELEQAIATVWRDVLGVEQISVHDNFFDIGGHSLLAVRAITRLERAVGVRLNQANMVLQTLEQLAAECAKRVAGASV